MTALPADRQGFFVMAPIASQRKIRKAYLVSVDNCQSEPAYYLTAIIKVTIIVQKLV